MNNKIGSYNLLYVTYARFHLNVFNTQVRILLISRNESVTGWALQEYMTIT